MPLVSSSIPNLINGVSQQPAALRLASQAESVINCMPSPVEGLKKRPPMYNVARMFAGSAGAGRPFVHIVDRDGAVRYMILIQDGAIRVFDLNGVEQTVTTPDGVGYLNINNASDPSNQFRVASVADVTFIVNREQTVAMANTTSPTWGTKSMVFCKTADYATTYRITVNSTTVSYTTANSGGAAPDSVTIASNLASSLSSALGAGWTISSQDYIVKIQKNDGGDYTLSATDSRTAEGTIALKGTTDSISDLPLLAEHGFIIKIQGQAASNFDDYYVRFETNAGSGFGHGTWRETVAPGIQFEFNAATMPHVLVRNANGTFTFEQFNWSGRIAGDATTVPDPSFVGSTIQNVTLFRNRLVFLADENVILSAADSYDRFWPETVQTVIDSDPIDISTGGTEINFLVSSLAFANTLLLFSRHGQFRLDTGATTIGTSLTPRTATITAITTYEMQATVDPVGVGRTIYFAIPKGDFSGIREFFLPDASGPVPLSEEVTAAVPRYLPGNLSTLVASVSEEAIIAISRDQPGRIYLYKFFFEEDTKLQSSWSYWQVGAGKTIIGADILDSDLYVIVQYGDGVYLERVALRPETVDSGTSFEILLDRKTTEASCTVALTNPAGLDVQSTITLPYPMAATGAMVVVGRFQAGNTIQHGQVLFPIAESLNGGAGGNGTMTVRGDLTNADFYVGELYNMTYEFSTPYLKEQPPGGGMAVAAGPRLQLRTWTVVFDDTSSFQLRITPQGRDAQTYPYEGLTVGSGNVLLGNPQLATGKFRAPVMAQNTEAKIELLSNSPLPCRVQSAEWEGWYHSRASRL